MIFYKNINTIRIISDLKNGIPVAGNVKHKITKNSSKNFYFAKECLSDVFLKELNNFEVITTVERVKHGVDEFKTSSAEQLDEVELLELVKFAELKPLLVKISTLPEHFHEKDILTIDVDEAIDFRKNFIYELRYVSDSPISLKFAPKAHFFVFRTPLLSLEHYIIKIGEPEKDKVPLIRIHSSCYTGDLLASLRCDCRDQLQEGIKFIAENKEYHGGYVLYLMQEGRGIGLANKIDAYNLQQKNNMDTVDSNLALGFKEDERNFMPAIKMLEFLQIKEIDLITNNPKKANEVEGLGIKVRSTIPTFYHPNPENKEYLKVKGKRMNHKYIDI
jgi:GTP cyclohydrolase II